MSREIKFRGYDSQHQVWRHGSHYKGVMTDAPLCVGDCRINHVIICDGTFYHVAPESVGEFTGLRDQNGVEIYEGDILSFGLWNDNPDLGDCLHVVQWVEAGFVTHCREEGDDGYYSVVDNEVASVVGNIYQHPELLEPGQ